MNTFNHKRYPTIKGLLFGAAIALGMSIDMVSARTIASQVNRSSDNTIDQPPKSIDPNNMIIMDDSNNSGTDAAANKENSTPPCLTTHNCDTGAGVENQRFERQQK